MTRVLVCGGRNVLDTVEHIYDVLDKFHTERPITLIIHGGAKGIDTLAGRWAFDREVECKVFRADWRTYGLSAGPRRNQRMLDEGQPDEVIAFRGGRGTADMVRRATSAGLHVTQGLTAAGQSA